MIFDGKIQAIKALRDATRTHKLVMEPHPDVHGQFVVKLVHDPALAPCSVGLKEAKELVESIMELGKREYIRQEALNAGFHV